MHMNEFEFIKHEMAVWGEDYIESLLNSGFEPVQVRTQAGVVKWTWRLPVVSSNTGTTGSNHLTNGSPYATV